MQRQTVLILVAGGACLALGCLATGIVGGVLIARRQPVVAPPAPVGTEAGTVPPEAAPPPTAPAAAPPAPAPIAALPSTPPATPAPPPIAVDEPWETRTDPLGFSVSAPRSWKVESDRATGRARLTGPRSEEILAWPVFVTARLDATSARALLSRLADKLVSRVQWAGADSPKPGVARARGLAGPGRPAVALLTWATGPEGTAGQVFFAMSGDGGPIAEEVLAKILGSFRATGAAAGAGAPGGLTYVRWKEPTEGAWSVEVPKGWKVTGGLKRFAPTDVRGEVVVTSPDKRIRVSAGDCDLPTFTEPNPTGVALGFKEGTWYSPSGTQKFMIRRFLTGLEVGREYVSKRIGQSVTELEVVKERERPELVAALNEAIKKNAQPGQSGRATAGEVAFKGQLEGSPCVGSYFVGTRGTTLEVAGIDPISLWNVVLLYGYAATKEKADVAASVLDRLVKSFEYSPEWVRMQQNITIESARIVHETNEDISKKLSESYWRRAASESEISRRRSNATLGVEDVTDPGSNMTYKVESGSNYYWLDDRGYIVGTDTPGAPSVEYRELVRQP